MNARRKTFDGIHFKSILEANCYKKLKASGLLFKYESERVTLWTGKRINNVPLYERKKGVRLMEGKVDDYKLRDMTYTPDFVIEHKNYVVYVDAKGHATDMYMLKKKMFIQHLSERKDGKKYMFFEPRNLTQMDQTINIIKKL